MFEPASRGYDRSRPDLDSLRPGLKSAFAAKRRWIGRQTRMDQSKMSQKHHERRIARLARSRAGYPIIGSTYLDARKAVWDTNSQLPPCFSKTSVSKTFSVTAAPVFVLSWAFTRPVAQATLPLT